MPPDGENTDKGKDSSSQNTDTPASFDDWFKTQDSKVQSMIDSHIAPLKNAHERQKETNRELKEQISSLKSQKDEDLRNAVNAVQSKAEMLERRAAFYENIPRDIVNAKAAYTLAAAHDLLNSDGTLKEREFREQFPELVGKKGAGGNTNIGGAGGGSDTPPNQTKDMNAFIRRASGR